MSWVRLDVPPTITVRAVYPGANPTVLSQTVATPLEDAINGVERMLYMSSSATAEAVKLTAVNLLQDDAGNDDPTPQSYRAAAEIVGYCMIGADAFAGANGEELTRAVERRIEAAMDAGDGLDAQLVLLTLHAKVIQPSVVSHFGLESARD